MTILDDRDLQDWLSACPRPDTRPGRTPVRRTARPVPARPAVAPLCYRGTGVRMSRAQHPVRTARPVGAAVTAAIAGLAALITLWLGALALFSGGGSAAATSPSPERLGVVRVQAGESLRQLAVRVAPEASAVDVVQRIRELNKLDSVAVDAGQTLIAPVG